MPEGQEPTTRELRFPDRRHPTTQPPHTIEDAFQCLNDERDQVLSSMSAAIVNGEKAITVPLWSAARLCTLLADVELTILLYSPETMHLVVHSERKDEEE